MTSEKPLARRANDGAIVVSSHVSFDAPAVAAEASLPGRLFIGGVAFAALCSLLAFSPAPLWPTPWPAFTAIAFVVAIVFFNQASAYQRYGEFARVVGLETPIVLALVWLVPWHYYALAVVVAEFGIFLREARLAVNPTVWYVRVFNACEMILAGAAAELATGALRNPDKALTLAGSSSSARLFFALLAGAVAWKLTDMFLTHACLSLANGMAVGPFDLNAVQLCSEFAVLFSAVPLALAWSIDVWLALFVLASIAGGTMLLHFSEIQYRLRFDSMTGVVNSRTFHEAFAAAVGESEKWQRPVALLIIDFDHFKAVNDTFGHDFGDRTLSWFAGVLKGAARAQDLLGRIGGEEFALLVRNVTSEQALEAAERLRGAIAAAPYVSPSADPLRITASIGVALHPVNGESARAVFQAADVALYVAKRDGRNRVRVASYSPPEHATR